MSIVKKAAVFFCLIVSLAAASCGSEADSKASGEKDSTRVSGKEDQALTENTGSGEEHKKDLPA